MTRGPQVGDQLRLQRPPERIGHMLGVFKAPDGGIWVTSNGECAGQQQDTNS